MFAHPPHLEGSFATIAVTPDSPEGLGRFLAKDMSGALRVAEGEHLDVTREGTCLVEMPEGTRYLAHITHGRLHGPVSVIEIDGVSRETIEGARQGQAAQSGSNRLPLLLSQKLLIAALLLFPPVLFFLPPILESLWADYEIHTPQKDFAMSVIFGLAWLQAIFIFVAGGWKDDEQPAGNPG